MARTMRVGLRVGGAQPATTISRPRSVFWRLRRNLEAGGTYPLIIRRDAAFCHAARRSRSFVTRLAGSRIARRGAEGRAECPREDQAAARGVIDLEHLRVKG